MFLQGLSDRNERPYKHARIPSVLPGPDILDRFVEMRLFDKLLGAIERGLIRFGSWGRGEGNANPDVAVARRWFAGLDSNRHNRLSARRQVKGIREHPLKGFLVRDHMVGRQD